jgi:hypothetical protein
MSTIYEKLGSGQPAFSTETPIGDYVISYPLGPLEPTALEITRPYTQYRVDYTRPAADTPLTLTVSGVSRTAYFIDDVNFSTEQRGGLWEWTRIWRTVPASWTDDGQYAFTYPAYSSAGGIGNSFPVTAISANISSAPYQYTLTTTATGLSAGNSVFLDLNYKSGSSNNHVSGVTGLVAASSGSSITITDLILYTGLSYTSVTGTVRAASAYRTAPLTLRADCQIVHDYALSNTANVANTLPTIEAWGPIEASTGAATTSLSNTTIPTNSTYQSMVDAGTLIIAEPTTRSRYAGNIYERTTILVPAR